MNERQEFLTFCPICVGNCSRKAVVEDGRLVELERDMVSGLHTEWCPTAKGRSVIEILSHPDRLKYPQKRKGQRGEGNWERISWDGALDTIAYKFQKIKKEFGPEYVALGLGEPKRMEFAFAQRFASAFGTPNVITPGHVCGELSAAACVFTYGSPSFFDTDEKYNPKLTILWGANPIHTNLGMRREHFRSALISGMKLLVIDPNKIDIAKRADLWIRLRPGSDGALALGMLKVIVEQKLYDEAFVDKWTIGFEHLQEQVKSFSLHDVEKVTWVPWQQIEKAAKLYAEFKPATIQWGNALEQIPNSLQTCRTICILRAITGNLCIPGGEVFFKPAPFTRVGRFALLKEFPRNPERAIGGEHKWAMMRAYTPYQALINSILEEKPYPIKAAMFIFTNPLSSYPDAAKAYRALLKLDFMVVSEIFMTPTAALADIVLPAATGFEHDAMGHWPPLGDIRWCPKLVEPPGECWSDAKIINELAKRMGLGEYFWNDENEALELMLKPSGISLEDFKKRRILPYEIEQYRGYENNGFRTASGKAEIYSQMLEDFGYSAFPRWEELSQLHFDISEEYPLLLTNAKEEAYYLTGYKHINYLRRIKPQPTVEINPETARKAGLVEGEWVYIETRKGEIKQKLSINTSLDPRVVYVSFGWWFPEEASDLYNWRKSNLNILTEDGPPYDALTGGVEIRGIPCRVYKA